MSNIKTREIKGYSENFEDLYFTDKAIELHVEDGNGGMERIIIADKKGDLEGLDRFRQDFYPLRDIEVSANKTEFKDSSKAVNRIFGTTVEYKGTITIDSKPRYGFYTIQKTGTLCGLFDGVKAAEIRELK